MEIFVPNGYEGMTFINLLYLKLQFATILQRVQMPTLRGSDVGIVVQPFR